MAPNLIANIAAVHQVPKKRTLRLLAHARSVFSAKLIVMSGEIHISYVVM
jgi:hypothetical protein